MPHSNGPRVNDLPLRSDIPHLKYPAFPDPRVLPILGYLYQLERAQWMTPAQHRALIFSQLKVLLSASFETVPYYREALGNTAFNPTGAFDEAVWAQIPILTRNTLQEQGKRLLSTAIPQVMQPFKQTKSSGSTGMPVEVYQPATKMPMMYATSILEPLIHGADFGGKTASIRLIRGEGVGLSPRTAPDWGAPTSVLLETGPSATLPSEVDPEQQADWVIREDPQLLQMFPSNLEALLPILEARGAELPGLQYFRTMGEQLPDHMRDQVRRQLDRKIVDAYSTQEVGLIAMQCPEHDHYHLVHDMVFTEILRDDGTPCDAGEIGRVVVTDLFNAGFPLIRYAVGDYAEMGSPCDCGRSWPVINRVMGRVRNLITFPDGHREWPRAPGKAYAAAIPMIQYQVIQTAPDKLHLNFVMKRPLTEEDRTAVIKLTKERMGDFFEVTVADVPTIDRAPSGKYEEFKSEIAAP
jgi:phenylacetate-CoA ligase